MSDAPVAGRKWSGGAIGFEDYGDPVGPVE